jgi:hypothetical protein
MKKMRTQYIISTVFVAIVFILLLVGVRQDKANANLNAERERRQRLERQLRSSHHAMRVQGVVGRPSPVVADALVGSYHATAKRVRSNSLGDQNPNSLVAAASFQDAATALKTLLSAVERDPGNLPAWAALARQALVTSGAGDVFVKAIAELKARDPDNAYPYQLEAIQASKVGDLLAAYKAITAAAQCNWSDDYRLDQIAYREAFLEDSGHSSGQARQLAIQGVWSQTATLSDQLALANSLTGFADKVKAEGRAEVAAATYLAIDQYASQLVGQSWTLMGEIVAHTMKKNALQGLQGALGQDATAVSNVQRSLSETNDRLSWLREISAWMSTSSETFQRAVSKSDAELATYYDNVLKYGEANAVEMVLRTLQVPPAVQEQ